MKRTTLITAAVSASLLAIGCAFRAPPETEVLDDDFDLAPLVGKWTGEYDSEETGRRGDIAFTLRAGERAASGYIEMIARQPENVMVVADRPIMNVKPSIQAKQLLTIHFVRKEGNNVVGLLDSYTDPNCACTVITTFQGVFKGGHTIEGTYRTVSSELAHTPTGGQWKVTRSKRL